MPISSRETFTNLYPFLPAHFDILLHLLGALAKSTGGIGLRSAIKVIQDVLIEGEGKLQGDGSEQQVGWLATTVTLYDELEKDIRRAFTSILQAVGKVHQFASLTHPPSGHRQDRRGAADPRQPAGDAAKRHQPHAPASPRRAGSTRSAKPIDG
jgi:hypothetical protein